MALTKQAKTLNKNQISAVLNHLANRRNALRNQTIFLLSVRAGLRAKEIACLRWDGLPHLTRSTFMYRERRTENGKQAAQARGDSSEVTAG